MIDMRTDSLLELHTRAAGRWIVYPDGMRQLVRNDRMYTVQRFDGRMARIGGGDVRKNVLVQGFSDLDKPLYQRRKLFRHWREDISESMRWAAGGDVGEVSLEELEAQK